VTTSSHSSKNLAGYFLCDLVKTRVCMCRSQWPRDLRRRSSAARLLRLWVWHPPGAWTSVRCECCLSSGRAVCVGPILRPEESYRVCVCVCVCHSVWWGAKITFYIHNEYVEWSQRKKEGTDKGRLSDCYSQSIIAKVWLQCEAGQVALRQVLLHH